ncbi:hypothetical protein [Halopenitus persicus]|uniref:Uncharacterized protein n=1 Tax=Halopenitus persicus TaxID=1048396 RepID=A0A1H3JMF7_9EURY|nr:hypothetical protein [Halopenitus persicus]SDY40598.1 hypothetical protein SAMN05216564_10557 [Halopenitus persicus]
MSDRPTPTRRRFVLAGAVPSVVGLAGCSALEAEDLGADQGDADADTETERPPTEQSPPERAFSATFDDGVGDWTGDVDAIESTDEAARGGGAVRMRSEAQEIELPIPETTVDRYSIWWRVEEEVNDVRFEFRGPDGRVGFGAEVRTGTNGLTVVVNPETDSGAASDLLSSAVRPGNWYQITFDAVDFEAERFDAALADVGDSELIRMTQSFRSPIDAVAALTVRSQRGDAVIVDDVVVGRDG